MKAIGILWNSMNNYIEAALDDIKNYAVISDVISINFQDDFSDFVSKIYPYTGKEFWKLEYKLKNMEKYDNKTITIIFLDIQNNKKIFVERKKIYIYENVEKLKSFIRNKYKDIVDGYSFDNVFHMTDDEIEFDLTNNLIIDYILNYYSNKNGFIDLNDMLHNDYSFIDKNIVNGKRNKFFFCNNNLLFKEQKDNSCESYGEKFCCELFKRIGLSSADYYLAKYNNKNGIVTKNFIKDDDLFLHGTYIINGYLNYLETGYLNFNIPIKYDIQTITRLNNLNDLSKIFRLIEKKTLIKTNSVIDDLKKLFVVDLILLQSDRNPNNWGILFNKKTNNVTLAPLYDNSNMCMFNKSNILDSLYKLANSDKSIFMDIMYKNSPTLLTETINDNYLTPKNILIESINDYELIKYLKQYAELISINEKEVISKLNNEKINKVLSTIIEENVKNINNICKNKTKKLV